MIKKFSILIIVSAIISLSLFLLMQAIVEIPQHTKNKGMFSDYTLMGRSYLTTANEEVINKAPDYIFDPNLLIRHYHMICLCEGTSIKPPLHTLIFSNNLIIKRSYIFL